jgi:hypothetical protein
MFLPRLPEPSSGQFCHPFLTHVADVDPVYGWSLMSFEAEDSDGFWSDHYVAVAGCRFIQLDVSRHCFKPTQERFAWLVRNGFPKRPTPNGGWFDDEIDARIATERKALAA